METHPHREVMRKRGTVDAIVRERIAKMTQQGHEQYLKAAQDNQRNNERASAESHKQSPFRYGDPI